LNLKNHPFFERIDFSIVSNISIKLDIAHFADELKRSQNSFPDPAQEVILKGELKKRNQFFMK